MEQKEKEDEAPHIGDTPGPDAQVIEALDKDKPEDPSPVEGYDDVEITSASERTS